MHPKHGRMVSRLWFGLGTGFSIWHVNKRLLAILGY